MAVLPIRMFGDPVLRQRAREVESITDVHRRLVADMLDTMRDASGVGLAGPQVGVMERIFVWEVGEEHGALINPRIVSRSEATEEAEEGCLSIPGLAYPVVRASEVVVEALDENGDEVRIEGTELLARVCQHEIDHIDGVLFLDHLTPELRRDAMRQWNEQTLGLSSPAPTPPPEEVL
jgi:peptide deformylase